MNTKASIILKSFIISLSMCLTFFVSTSSLAKGQPDKSAQKVISHWTPDRISNAIPRDFVIDDQGRGHIRRPDGSLIPYGHNNARQISSLNQIPFAKPPGVGGGNNDTISPTVTNMIPANNDAIGAIQLFSATIIDDASGIKSVTFIITYPDGINTQSFTPSFTGSDNWEINLQGFTDGNWSWQVIAKDGAGKGGNITISTSVNFTVNIGSGGSGGDSHIVTNAAWAAGGDVQTAAGRIYFEMPSNAKLKGPWSAYVCSGTVATDTTSGRSIIITASHCVYDDSNKAFARNILFIPNQAGTTASGTDTNCSNDPLGCWVPSFGVVDVNWTTRTFPNNIEWDYAYYVVSDTGSHAAGTATSTDSSLDTAAGSLAVNFLTAVIDDGDPSASSVDFTHALGYSYSDDPNFMYCAEDMTTEGAVNWWLASCALSGGASGGPWVQPMDEATGTGPIISVNSWGYTTSDGMAGPKLAGSSADCLFTEAKGIDFVSVSTADGSAGVVVDYCP